MRAVNLIPAEERRGSRSPLANASGATLGLLGALVLALLVVVAYVTLSNTVSERRQAVAEAGARADALEAEARALKPYGDVVSLRDETIATVSQLAAQRFDWPALMHDLSVRVPSDVTLTVVSGEAAPGVDAAAVAAAGGTATAAAAPGPVVTLAGCTESHRSVARLMDRLRGVRGVTDVVLASSAHADEKGKKAGRKGKDKKDTCPRIDHFEVALTMGGTS